MDDVMIPSLIEPVYIGGLFVEDCAVELAACVIAGYALRNLSDEQITSLREELSPDADIDPGKWAAIELLDSALAKRNRARMQEGGR